jgi:hypothetical protein
VLDSGDYQAGVDHAVEAGGLAELCRRRNQARAEGRFNGIGYAAAVEPPVCVGGQDWLSWAGAEARWSKNMITKTSLFVRP